MLADHQSYATVFLVMVAVPSVIGELSLTIWLHVKGGKERLHEASLSEARG